MAEIDYFWLVVGFAWGWFMYPVLTSYFNAAKEIYTNTKKEKDEGSTNNR